MGFQTRSGPRDGPDDFPTPPWATRAYLAHCLPDDYGADGGLSEMVAWEPCANRGYMVNVLREKFQSVYGSDMFDYGAGFPLVDFLEAPDPHQAYGANIDYIITNPPFNAAEAFFHHWYDNMPSVDHLHMLLRTSWLEGWNRYETIFNKHQPAYVCPYVGRVPMVKGRLQRKAATQMPYAWFQWDRGHSKYSPSRIKWIPAKCDDWEREGDWPENVEVIDDVSDEPVED